MRSAKAILVMAIAIVGIMALVPIVSAAEGTATEDKLYIGLIAIGAGLAVGIAGLGAGIGEASIGAAAVGAMAEDPKTFGKGLLLTVIPETIVIFGFVIAALLWFMK